MNFLRAFCVIMLIGTVLFGCISPYSPIVPPGQENISGPNITPSCKTVVTQEPYNETVCQNVSQMEEVCGNRELNYSLGPLVKTLLCLENNLCAVRDETGACRDYYCSRGMTRCRINLTNLDTQKAADWSVGANFTIGDAVFGQNPVTQNLLPQETKTFDFQMLYDLDLSQKKAGCSLFVVSVPKLQDCSFITRIVVECQNVTKTRDVEKQVCG